MTIDLPVRIDAYTSVDALAGMIRNAAVIGIDLTLPGESYQSAATRIRPMLKPTQKPTPVGR